MTERVIIEVRHEGDYVAVEFDGDLAILSPGNTYRVVLKDSGELARA